MAKEERPASPGKKAGRKKSGSFGFASWRRSSAKKKAEKEAAANNGTGTTANDEVEPLAEGSEKFVKKQEVAEYRDGQRINPNPVVKLTTPVKPPPLDEAGQAARNRMNDEATEAIMGEIKKYTDILRNVSLFSEMGDEELEIAARALQVVNFTAGEIIYDEGDEVRRPPRRPCARPTPAVEPAVEPALHTPAPGSNRA